MMQRAIPVASHRPARVNRASSRRVVFATAARRGATRTGGLRGNCRPKTKEASMFHPKVTAALAAVAAVAIASGLTLAAGPASAGNVAWSVSVGGPGFAVTAGGPGYRGAYWGRPYARPYYRPYYYSAYYPAPIVYGAPVVYPAPVIYPAPVYVPRRVVVPVVRGPVWGGGYRIY